MNVVEIISEFWFVTDSVCFVFVWCCISFTCDRVVLSCILWKTQLWHFIGLISSFAVCAHFQHRKLKLLSKIFLLLQVSQFFSVQCTSPWQLWTCMVSMGVTLWFFFLLRVILICIECGWILWLWWNVFKLQSFSASSLSCVHTLPLCYSFTRLTNQGFLSLVYKRLACYCYYYRRLTKKLVPFVKTYLQDTEQLFLLFSAFAFAALGSLSILYNVL